MAVAGLLMQAGVVTAAETVQTTPRPLVSAAEVPAPQKSAGEKEEASGGTAETLRVTGIIPERIGTSNKTQRIIVRGSGFTEGCRVALSRNGQIEVWPENEVEYLSGSELAINVITGEMAADWSVMVGNRDNRTSNRYVFTVEAHQANDGGSVEGAGQIGRHGTKTPVIADADRPLVTPPPPGGPAERKIFGSEWLRRQPETHYTLQLMASNSRVNLMVFARQYPQLAPLASFAVKRNGDVLHVLTLGSYSSRQAAEKAVGKVPPGIKPWPRNIADIRAVMVAVPTTPTREVNAEPAGKTVVKDAAWVWSQNPEYYTVQLAAAESKQAIEAAMQSAGLTGEMAIVGTRRNDKQWYVLIHGSFSSRSAAHASIERLPVSLRNAKPWPRAFAGLQEALSKGYPGH